MGEEENNIVLENEKTKIKKCYKIFKIKEDGSLCLPREHINDYGLTSYYKEEFSSFNSETEALEELLDLDKNCFDEYVVLPVYERCFDYT